MNYLLLAAGAALGGVARYAFVALAGRWLDAGFPWPILWINASGSVLIGLLAALGLAPGWRLFAMAGFCGGFTTFSTFGLETLELLREGQTLKAAANAFGSVVFSVGGAAAGFAAGSWMRR